MDGSLVVHCPVHRDHDARAVRDQDDRALDGGERAVELAHPRGARELVAVHARHRSRIRKLLLEQRLPVLRYVIAQSRDDQYRWYSHDRVGQNCASASSSAALAPLVAASRKPGACVRK